MTSPISDATIRVVEASLSDAEEIHSVVNEAYKRDFFRFPERPRASYEKIRDYFLDKMHTWYIVKNDQNRIIATVLYSSDKAPESATEGDIHMLAARTAFWGQKLSVPLLQKIYERALQDKKSKLQLIVANTNLGLIKFYEKQGFRLTGKTFELPLTSVQPQFQQKDPDGRSKICCLYMEKDLKIRSHL